MPTAASARSTSPPTTEGSPTPDGGPRYDTHELAPFLAATIPLTHSLTCDAALRYGFYLLQGDGRIASYRHASPQPSLSLDWQVARGSRLRASYNYITQYIHKVPSSNISFSTDFWMAPTRRTPPQHTHHAALGYFAEAAGGRLNFSAEAYYQRMYRVLEYNAPLTGMVNNRYELEQYLHSGDGEAYGMEFMVSYAGRKFNGWISYTLGKSVRQFAALNNGLPFPASLDRRHDLSLAASYMPGERWELSTVFVYASAAPIPDARPLHRRRFVRPRTRLLQRRPPAGLPPARPVGHLLAAAETVAQRHQSLPLQPLRPPQPALHLVAGARRRREARIPDPSASALPLHRHPLRKLDFQILNAP